MSIDYRARIHYYLYEDTINFGYLEEIYNKYLGGISFLNINNKKENETEQVFGETIKYKSFDNYKDGIKLLVSNNYLVPSIYKGTVTYIGNNDVYGKMVIIKNNDGIDTWYGNICNSNLKMYDKVEQYSYIGESCSDYIYLVWSEKGKFLNYKDYFNKS